MGFNDLIADDILDVFADEDYHGASVVYYPKHGGKRTISAGIQEDATTELEKGQVHETKKMMVTLLFLKSGTDGISKVSKGDTVDYLGVLWAFHSVIHEDAVSLAIQWKRETVISAGMQSTGF
jgi:hypothetical protein